MKFSDGYWGVRDGVRLMSPSEVRDVSAADGALTVFAPCRPIRTRGDTLNTPALTLRFSSPMPDVIRVEIFHFKGARQTGPAWETAAAEGFVPRIGCTEEEASLVSGDTRVRVAMRGPWDVSYFHAGRRLTGSGPPHTASIIGPDGASFMREQLSLAVGECVYGLGERFTAFAKNGQTVDTWNEDGGTCSEQAYKNVPFYLTNRGYGVLVAHPERVSFEIASEAVSRAQFSVPGERLEYFIVGGKEPREVLRRYTELTGRPARPPAWSFGLWLTTSFTTDYDERTVNRFIDGMRDRGIPLHVFHFDCFWMKEFQWCDFQWDRAQFPDPEAIIGRLKARGLRVSVWINPYIAQKSALFDEGMRRGFLLKKPDGGVWQWDRWQAGMGLVDFTSAEATAWFKDQLRRVLRAGVDCFKSDFGERIPTDVVYANGADPQKMHNYYTYLYNRAVFEVMQEERGPTEAVVFARSATVGSQKFPVHWGGDCSATFESMAESLRGGLSLGLSGFGFWSHDIGGFEGTPTPDLYKRWAAFGMLSSHSRLHGNESYRVPWLFDEESSAVLKAFVALKCRLMPYLYAAACEAARDGIPVMRAMLLEFPDDPTCLHLDRQYMLGGALLVAPIFQEDGTVSYYLPPGRWTSLLTGKRIDGAAWQAERHDYMGLPLMARPNSIIAIGAHDGRPDYDFADGVTFHLFELDDGAEAKAAVHDLRGKEEMSMLIRRAGPLLTVAPRGARKPWRVCLRNIHAAQVDGGTLETGEAGLVLSPRDLDRPVTVRLPEGR